MESHIPGQLTLPSLTPEIGYSSNHNLKPPHERFCHEIILSGEDAVRAYMRAYPKASEPSARANASRLLGSEKIIRRISEIRAELRRRYAIDAQSVVGLLSMTMGVDRRQFVDRDGKPLGLHELPPEAAAIVDIEIITDRHGTKQAVPKVPERIKAASELAKILGISREKSPTTPDDANGDRTQLTDEELATIINNEREERLRILPPIIVNEETPGGRQ